MHVKFENLSHKFVEDQYIFQNLNFEDEFSSLALIGPSGCGKSTLLRILGGLIKPTSGTFSINGQSIVGCPRLSQWNRKIGFVFQSNGLFPHLTGLENIMLPLEKVFNIEYSSAKKTAYELLERFGLENDGDKYPKELSGGQQQRIAIARAVAIDPEILLLDEPTSALDPEYTSEVLDMIDELTKNDLKIILVTHEMGFARSACDKAIFLYGGTILEYKNSEDFFENPQSDELKHFLHKILEWK